MEFYVLVLVTIICFPSITTDGKTHQNYEEYHEAEQVIQEHEHGRNERAIEHNNIIVIRQRRRKIITCCGKKKCTEGRETTEDTTAATTTTTTLTTTTRCTPACLTCVDRKWSLWNNYGNLIDRDSYGTWGELCSRTYLFSKTTADYPSAHAVCCSLGMYLFSVPSIEERKCLHDANNALATSVSGKFLASAWRDTCPEYTWCFGSIPMSENIWMTSSGDPHGGDESCAVLNVQKGDPPAQALEDVKCNVPANFICEGPVTTCSPECPVTECTTDYSLYGVDGDLITPASVGLWKTPIGATCETNKMYFFSTGTKSYADAGKFCCSVGMTLLSIETPAEHQCITDLNNADMKLADSYWTSAASFNCKSKSRYKWCVGDTFIYAAIPWNANQPDYGGANEWCSELMLKTGTDADTLLTDSDCAALKKFICEGPTTTTTTCATPTCTDIPCVIDPNAFIPEGGIKTPAKYGTFYSICGFNYLFSSVATTYCSARKACCRLGMQLVSLDTRDNQIDCLYDFNNETSKLTGPYYVNALTSTKLTGFKWCPSTNYIDYMWITGEPKDTPVPQFAATMLLDSRPTNRDVILAGSAVTTPQKFICEEQQAVPPLCTAAVCPTFTCQVDQYTHYNIEGTYKNPGAHGKFKACNDKLYLFSWPMKTYADALKYCCDIGMKLVSLETAAEETCLADLNKNEVDLKYSLPFWTSGTQNKCHDKFKWCGENVVFNKADYKWASGEPTNYQNRELCVLQTYAAAGGALLSDELCSGVKNFICEGPTTTTTTCATPTCADPPCTKDASIFDASGALIAPFKFGTFVTACGGIYMFNPSARYNWCQAKNICCRIGMKMISVESATEKDCLFDLAISGNITAGLYWTSGLTSTVKTGFSWCSSNTPVDATLWAAGAPDNFNPAQPEYVAFLKLDTSAAGARNTLNDGYPGSATLGVACEG